jgi:hypothetical protein
MDPETESGRKEWQKNYDILHFEELSKPGGFYSSTRAW